MRRAEQEFYAMLNYAKRRRSSMMRSHHMSRVGCGGLVLVARWRAEVAKRPRSIQLVEAF